MNCTEECGDDSSFVGIGGSDSGTKNTNICTEKVVGNNKQDDVLCTDDTIEGNTIENEPLTTPSCGENCEHETGESHVGGTMGVRSDGQSVNQGTEFEKMNRGTECEKIMKNDCEFKRGGMCKTHLVRGEKIVTKSREWVKKKNGLFGYVTKQLTTYRCSRSAVIEGPLSPTIARETMTELDSGLRLGEILPGDNLSWDCGAGLGGAVANKDKSESLE